MSLVTALVVLLAGAPVDAGAVERIARASLAMGAPVQLVAAVCVLESGASPARTPTWCGALGDRYADAWRGAEGVVTAPAIVAAVLVALGWTLPAWVAPAISRASRELGADVPLVLAVCAQESALGRTRAPLCGALGRRVGPDAVSQAYAAARAFPAGAGVRRWRARLVTWRCGWDRQCAAVVGAGYAARVLALRARIARAGGVR